MKTLKTLAKVTLGAALGGTLAFGISYYAGSITAAQYVLLQSIAVVVAVLALVPWGGKDA